MITTDNPITARHYVAQAEVGIKNYLEMIQNQPTFEEESKLISRFILRRIKDSVHFALPDNASIFNDDFKGIEGRKIRLPFPKITIEYFSDESEIEKNDEPFKESCPKRVLFCEEVSSDVLIANGIHPDLTTLCDLWINVVGVCFYESQKRWFPLPLGFFMPTDWQVRPDEANTFKDIRSSVKRKSKHKVALLHHVVSPTIMNAKCKIFGEKGVQMAWDDLCAELHAVLEMSEALTCTNVSHEPIEKVNPSVNEKRIRKGKLPLYETRTLFIDTPHLVVIGKDKNDPSGRASPRLHLRRGHIRKLESGNIWVNSAVVGSKKLGVIDKNYAIH
jgi:hypothetical protein